jgi:hypothetical protein
MVRVPRGFFRQIVKNTTINEDMRLIIPIIVMFLFSCNFDGRKANNPGISEFTYDIQHGGDPHNKYDLKGQTDYINFVSAFDSFPWLLEIDKSNLNPQGCSPTLSVKNAADERDFWVAMSGDRTNNGYLVGYVYKKKKSFGFGKEKIIKWDEIYLPDNKQQVKDLFKIYFGKNYDQLHVELMKLEKFGENEVPIND